MKKPYQPKTNWTTRTYIAFWMSLILLALSSPTQAAEGPAALVVVIQTSMGNIEVELNADKAPNTVKNFLQYVNDHFYDGTIFHRVIYGFMIQGGGLTQEMEQKATREPIAIESNNGLGNDRGTIAMARRGDPNSATSQFFINTRDNYPLNYTAPTQRGYGYTVFGKVISGMDVVDKIEMVKTVSQGFLDDVPARPVIVEKISIKPAP